MSPSYRSDKVSQLVLQIYREPSGAALSRPFAQIDLRHVLLSNVCVIRIKAFESWGLDISISGHLNLGVLAPSKRNGDTAEYRGTEEAMPYLFDRLVADTTAKLSGQHFDNAYDALRLAENELLSSLQGSDLAGILDFTALELTAVNNRRRRFTQSILLYADGTPHYTTPPRNALPSAAQDAEADTCVSNITLEGAQAQTETTPIIMRAQEFRTLHTETTRKLGIPSAQVTLSMDNPSSSEKEYCSVDMAVEQLEMHCQRTDHTALLGCLSAAAALSESFPKVLTLNLEARPLQIQSRYNNELNESFAATVTLHVRGLRFPRPTVRLHNVDLHYGQVRINSLGPESVRMRQKLAIGFRTAVRHPGRGLTISSPKSLSDEIGRIFYLASNTAEMLASRMPFERPESVPRLMSEAILRVLQVQNMVPEVDHVQIATKLYNADGTVRSLFTDAATAQLDPQGEPDDVDVALVDRETAQVDDPRDIPAMKTAAGQRISHEEAAAHPIGAPPFSTRRDAPELPREAQNTAVVRDLDYQQEESEPWLEEPRDSEEDTCATNDHVASERSTNDRTGKELAAVRKEDNPGVPLADSGETSASGPTNEGFRVLEEHTGFQRYGLRTNWDKPPPTHPGMDSFVPQTMRGNTECGIRYIRSFSYSIMAAVPDQPSVAVAFATGPPATESLLTGSDTLKLILRSRRFTKSNGVRVSPPLSATLRFPTLKGLACARYGACDVIIKSTGHLLDSKKDDDGGQNLASILLALTDRLKTIIFPILADDATSRNCDELACHVANALKGARKIFPEALRPRMFVVELRQKRLAERRAGLKLLGVGKSDCSGNAYRDTTFLALGSNIGERLQTIEEACRLIDKSGEIRITGTSPLYETRPMYVEEQDLFLNGVCQVDTSLGPTELLDKLQAIEQQLGRVKTVEKGPRSIDLDILLYKGKRLATERLTIPHALMHEREFVLRPLADITQDVVDPLNGSAVNLLRTVESKPRNMFPYTPLGPENAAIRAIDPQRPTRIMSILNMTPDSFSDGGTHLTTDSEALKLTIARHIAGGATIIDVGGQSSRPNAPDVTAEDECLRVLKAIEAIKSLPEAKDVAISIDTYRATVAEAAIKAGAHIVNDISAGLLDPEMLPTVARLGCTYVMMHMRGTPATMQSDENTSYPDGLVRTMIGELSARLNAAQAAGIRRWRIILDPGIGFSKTQEHNLEILRRLPELINAPDLQNMPWLVGSSRKGFIGKITGVETARERTWGTAATVAAAVQGGADVVRVHDVKEMAQVAKMADAMYRRQ
ncbi:hypothetical protein BAUCODRAFT_150674 [Baudoinia panamericana UAMH 10762]|uniref:Folic acid synthesis protein FOL1 n=1 Tax=Baudoinia panamericana (strain UAMH 10762) TaxID=717646 RepID=M2N2X0_BAUPA|nr:uncharacterized protein BAUCODRAFT_150674 [Baudoinia panamericana UAMH 10762]EMC93329.1 hypothetical protein BAUCODRAFT_150674 [Baudoinia panamericana UAMH 10762]